MADAYNDDLEPLFLHDCLTVCPAEHIAEAREIAAWHCLNVENLVETTVESMLPTAVGPLVGSVTHYVCFQRLFPENIGKERATLTAREDSHEWIDGSDSPADPLNKFCCLGTNLNDFLTAFGLEVK